jgi:hypothetical protein
LSFFLFRAERRLIRQRGAARQAGEFARRCGRPVCLDSSRESPAAVNYDGLRAYCSALAFSRFVRGLWLPALTANIQKHDNFQNNSRAGAALSSDRPGGCPLGAEKSVLHTWGWHFVKPCSNFQNLFLATGDRR